jgi:Fe-S-cluster containining protein
MMTESVLPWYKDGLQFECTVCGRCCTGGSGYVWVSQEEIVGIAAQMELTPLLFEQVFVWTVRPQKRSLKEYPNGDCVLLSDKTRRCRVYSQRPIQCRTWPFWSQNLVSPNTWSAIAATCPGCNRGKLYTVEEIEERRKAFEES